MKKIYAMALLLFVSFAFGQNRMVAKKIQTLNAKSPLLYVKTDRAFFEK